jgi:membrane fusion protein (multidrug efflux system)
MKLKQFIALATLALIGAGCGRKPAPPMTQPPEVATITVAPAPVVLTTELPGRTAAYRNAEIRPQVSGLIQKRLFTEGADVTAGEVLYQIDPAPFEAVLAKAEANLAAARSRAKRVEALLAQEAVSPQDYDDVTAALKLAEADAEMARINLGYTKVTAPISGRIGKSSVTEGAIVTAYQPVPLATIQQLDPVYVDVPQSTAELLRLQGRLADGRLARDTDNQNAVELILGSGAKYPQTGTLQFQDVTVDPTTATVTLRMVFPNPDGVLLPGMFVRAVVKEGVNLQALLIPQQAVLRDPKGNPLVMTVNAAGNVEPRPVTLDRAIGNQWLVAAGLAAGDRVIVEGILKTRPGAVVKAVPFTVAH